MLNSFMHYYRKKMFTFCVFMLGGGDERHGAWYLVKKIDSSMAARCVGGWKVSLERR